MKPRKKKHKCKFIKLAQRMLDEERHHTSPKNADALLDTLFRNEQSCRIFVRTLMAISLRRFYSGQPSHDELNVAHELAHQFYHWKE